MKKSKTFHSNISIGYVSIIKREKKKERERGREREINGGRKKEMSKMCNVVCLPCSGNKGNK